MPPNAPARLSQYPVVRVRIACPFCPERSGDFALVRLAVRFGAEAALSDVLYELTRDCRWQVAPEVRRRQYVPYCGVRFVDLEPEPAPDARFERRRLRVIEGGISARPEGYVPKWSRNPRRAYDADGREITPLSIANFVASGGRRVMAMCDAPRCGHEGDIDITTWAGHIFVPDIGLHLCCSACGERGQARIMPVQPWCVGMGARPVEG